MIKKHAHELLGRQETKTLLDSVKETYPTLVDELIPGVLSIGDVQKVLAKLLKEKVAIRDLVTICETLADYGNFTKDADILTEYVRRSLSRQITNQHVMKGEKLRVITFSPAAEKKMIEATQTTAQGTFVSLDPTSAQTIVQQIKELAHQCTLSGYLPLVFVSPTIRMVVRQLVDRAAQDITVLSYSELEPHVEVQSIGVVRG
jgi:flagellar biosynthesis protein FlhA